MILSRKPGLWAAVVSLTLLAGIAAEGASRPSAADAEPFHARVRAAAEAIPLTFGRWRGVETPMPPEVVALLHANALCNRRYVNADTSETFQFTLTQSSDARDMTGHFPPLCFAANGWNQDSATDRALWVAGASIPVREYVFSRPSRAGVDRLAVIHFIALPGRRYDRNLDTIWSVAADFTRRGYGAAQLELAFLDDDTPAHRDAVAQQFLAANQPLLDALGAPGNNSRQ